MTQFRVDGGIINGQTITGSLRFFKMVGVGTTFAWTVSDGTVNLPVSVVGGASLKSALISSTIHPTNQFVISGDHTTTLIAGTGVIISGTGVNDGVYTISSSVYVAPNTTVTVNENVPATLGAVGYLTGVTVNFFVVGNNRPVPNSAADIALKEISKQADIVMIGTDASYGSTTTIYFACSATAFGWGSNTPDYSTPPANTGEDLTAAAPAMQVAVNVLGAQTVYASIGAVTNSTKTPVTATAHLETVTITEVPFKLV